MRRYLWIILLIAALLGILAYALPRPPLPEPQSTVLPQSIGMPVSLVRLDAHTLALANYGSILRVDTRTGAIREIPKPAQVPVWAPTGLAYDPKTRELFVANYRGKDIVILKSNEAGDFAFSARITDPELVGPENASLSPDGKTIVAADYDNSGLLLFDRTNHKKIWFSKLGQAHGVAFDASGEFIYATGLAPTQIVKLDRNGTILQSHEDSGFGKHSYLWPTSVALDPSTQRLWTSDAHNGGIRQLNARLRTDTMFGGNGLGTERFNMPYGLMIDPDGSFWVADTFKSRIIQFDAKHRPIRYYLSPENTPLLAELCQDLAACTTSQPLESEMTGADYDGRINKKHPIRYALDGTDTASQWYEGYATFVATNSDRHLRMVLPYAISEPQVYYYWMSARTLEDGKFALYGSPQSDTWVLQHGKFICPLPLALNYWQTETTLANDNGRAIPYETIIRYCTGIQDRFEQAMAKTATPLRHYAKHVRQATPKEFARQLHQNFTSTPGIAYRDTLCKAKTDLERYELSQTFLKELQTEQTIAMQELWIAQLIGWKKPAPNTNHDMAVPCRL